MPMSILSNQQIDLQFQDWVGKRHKKAPKAWTVLGADSLTSYVRKYEKLAVRRRLNQYNRVVLYSL